MNINLKTMAMLHCGWQGSVITVKRDSGQVRVETLSHTYDKYQAKTSKASHNLPLSKSSKCLKCEAITDLCTGWTAPHLLVSHVPAPQALSYTHELLAYSPGDGVFTEQGLLFEVDEDDLPTETDGEGEGYHLLDGPTVLWKQGATVHIVHGPNLEQVCVTVRRPGVAVERVRKMWCVQGRAGGGGSEGGNVCVLLMLQLVLKEGGGNRYREFGEREWMCLEVTLKDGSRQMDCFQTLEAKRIPNLIPADYGYIASCVVPYWCSEMDDGYRGGLVERLGFAVGTEYQQVVLVEGGRMKQVISLQDTPQHIVPLKVINCVIHPPSSFPCLKDFLSLLPFLLFPLPSPSLIHVLMFSPLRIFLHPSASSLSMPSLSIAFPYHLSPSPFLPSAPSLPIHVFMMFSQSSLPFPSPTFLFPAPSLHPFKSCLYPLLGDWRQDGSCGELFRQILKCI